PVRIAGEHDHGADAVRLDRVEHAAPARAISAPLVAAADAAVAGRIAQKMGERDLLPDEAEARAAGRRAPQLAEEPRLLLLAQQAALGIAGGLFVTHVAEQRGAPEAARVEHDQIDEVPEREGPV